jgi:molecular chaperone GrpE (heat shock protein)
VNREPDRPGSEETTGNAGGGEEPGGDLNLPLDALLDWGTSPAMSDADLDSGLGAETAEALLAAERDEYLDSLRRLQADFDNFRKRSMRQQTELLDHATEGLCVRLLPVLDALDLATAHLRGQAETNDAGRALEQIDSLLRDILAREGVEKIDAVGVPFDPTIHDAVGQVPSEPAATAAPGLPGAPDSAGEADAGEPEDAGGHASKHAPKPKSPKSPAQPAGPTVAQVMRAGYRMKSNLLRPAMVLVGG